MKIKYNKTTKTFDVISITIFGETNLHGQFKTKEAAQDYVESHS